MTRLKWLVGILASAAVFALSPSPAGAGETACTGDLTGTFHNVIVPTGASCSLMKSTVRGNVKAMENSKLVITAGSKVEGNVEGDKAALVQVIGSTVHGNILIKEGGPATSPVPTGGIDCGTNNPCETLVLGVTAYGNVEIEKMHGTVFVFSSQLMKGNLKAGENVIPNPSAALSIGNNSVAGNLQVFKNTGSGSKFLFQNAIGKNVQCLENDLPFEAFSTSADRGEGQCASVAVTGQK